MQASSATKGALIGAGIGGLGGLGACLWFIPDEWNLFPGDTILAGAVIFGTLGFAFGESFIDWLKEHWHWFT
jgi:hypothetical protein